MGEATTMSQSGRDKIQVARQRLVFCHLMIELMRSLHRSYAPATESFGERLETFFVGMCVALGHIEDKPFTIAKIATYMRMSRPAVMRRLSRLQSWNLVYRQGNHYYAHEKALNSLAGMRSYRQIRQILNQAHAQLTALDASPD
jgi:DNA-binding transcriptional regulator GbsR (MarR family)